MSAPSLRRAGDHRSSLIVTALSAAFGVGLVQATAFLATMISGNSVSEHGSAQIALLLVATVFIVISVYVAAIVTANTFATIIAGRTRTLALLRLVGSSAGSLRRAVAVEGLRVGLLGSLIGATAGLALSFGCIAIGVRAGGVPDLDYWNLSPFVVLPVVFVIISTWAASWVGSRTVLAVTPMQATGATEEPSSQESRRRPVRNAAAAVLFFGGLAILVLGVAASMVTVLGFLIAFVGGILSFSGVVLGAHLVIPQVLRMTGGLLGSSPSARMAAANALRYPERSTRTAIGLVIGVTLITTFGVAAQGYLTMIHRAQALRPEEFAGIDTLLAVTVGVFSVLIGFSGVIAAFGMVNNLSLSVVQRIRELGLLRALGFTVRQVRGMIVAESAQMTIVAVGLGIILGTVYGWAGAQSLLGMISGKPAIIWPGLPWPLLIVLAVAAAAITLAAAQAPARRATLVSPVAALGVD